MDILITICARGGSKGVKNKNIKKINGIPLIKYSMNLANKFAAKHNAKITLSTEDKLIKNIAEKLGLTTLYKRPLHLSKDETGKLEVIRHVLLYEENNLNKKFDFILDLDVSSPLRNLDDLELALSLLIEDRNALNIFSVNNAERNPYFNMVEKKKNGYYGLVKKGIFYSRQSTPKVFDLNASFYFFKRSFFNKKNKPMINSRTLIYETPHICFDIDNQLDFDFMQYLIKNEKLDFNL